MGSCEVARGTWLSERSNATESDEHFDTVSDRVQGSRPRWSGAGSPIQHAHFFSRAVNSSPDLLKGHVAPVVEGTRILEITDGTDTSGNFDAIPPIESDIDTGDRHPQQTGCVTGGCPVTKPPHL